MSLQIQRIFAQANILVTATHIHVSVYVLIRFDYYNIGLRPRRLQRDRRQLVAHLELDQLLAVQRPSTVRDLTV